MVEETSNRLNARDLINVGIYTAFYIAVFWVAGMITIIPMLYPAMLFINPIVCGIPFMLFMTRVKKPGMVLIMSMLLALFWFAMGYTWIPLITFTVTGVLAEVIFKRAEYTNFKQIAIGYGVFSVGTLGLQLPLWVMTETYVVDMKEAYGEEMLNQVLSYMPWWMGIVGNGLIFVGALLGARLGRKMLSKHFERAGIA